MTLSLVVTKSCYCIWDIVYPGESGWLGSYEDHLFLNSEPNALEEVGLISQRHRQSPPSVNQAEEMLMTNLRAA